MGDTSEFTLREATASDSLFIATLKHATSPDVMPASVLWDDDLHRERVLMQVNTAVIIQVLGRDVGLFQLVYLSNQIHVMQIRLLAEYQSRGIGSKLLATLQVMCAKSNIPIGLHVYRNNRACELYSRLGFQVVKSDETAFFMRWSAPV
jgi:ribosomal protein S18 acetylase RimI-like enzyme